MSNSAKMLITFGSALVAVVATRILIDLTGPAVTAMAIGLAVTLLVGRALR